MVDPAQEYTFDIGVVVRLRPMTDADLADAEGARPGTARPRLRARRATGSRSGLLPRRTTGRLPWRCRVVDGACSSAPGTGAGASAVVLPLHQQVARVMAQRGCGREAAFEAIFGLEGGEAGPRDFFDGAELREDTAEGGCKARPRSPTRRPAPARGACSGPA